MVLKGQQVPTRYKKRNLYSGNSALYRKNDFEARPKEENLETIPVHVITEEQERMLYKKANRGETYAKKNLLIVPVLFTDDIIINYL